MYKTKQITSRELLRNFKQYKKSLASGTIKTIIIPMEEGKKIEISIRKEENNGENIARLFNNLHKPVKIKRTNIFEELF